MSNTSYLRQSKAHWQPSLGVSLGSSAHILQVCWFAFQLTEFQPTLRVGFLEFVFGCLLLLLFYFKEDLVKPFAPKYVPSGHTEENGLS